MASIARSSRRTRSRLAAIESDRRLLASAVDRADNYVSRATTELRESVASERSTVVRGGELRTLRRDRRTRFGGIVANGSTLVVRVGAERSELPAVATLRVGSRTARVGRGESFDSPGARSI